MNAVIVALLTVVIVCSTSFDMFGMASDTTGDIPTPCRTCPSAVRNWSQIPVATLTVTHGGCVFTAYVKIRTCPATGCIEIKLEKVTTDPNPCFALAHDDMVSLVMGKIVVDNVLGLDSAQGGSSACITIIRPACWRLTTLMPSPCGFDSTGPDELVNPWRVRYKVGQLQPCQPDECCTNTVFAQMSECGEYFITGSPNASEYKRYYRLQGRTSEDPEVQAKLDDAVREFERQFTNAKCRECPQDSTGDPEASFPNPTVPPPSSTPTCIRSCVEDLVREYYSLVNGGLRKKYEGGN